VLEVRPYFVEARQLLRRADEEGQLVEHTTSGKAGGTPPACREYPAHISL